MDLVSQNLLMTSGGKKDPTYVEDVFSTYLWRGDGLVGRAIGNGIKLSNNNAGNSVHFDGNGDFITQNVPDPYILRNWWSQAFTVEYWVYANAFSSSGNGGSTVCGVTTPAGGESWSFGPKNTGEVQFYYWNGSVQIVTSGKTLNTGQWYHLAFVHDGSNNLKQFVNGVLENSSTVSGSPSGASTEFNIGRVATADFNGKVSNLRITHQALYSSNFTPPTEALTTTSQGATESNVKLLCCQSSTSATAATKSPNTFTANGNVQAQAVGPFTATDGEGGLVWMKSRTTGNVNVLFDTERGANQRLRSDSNLGQNNVDNLQPSFTNSGFTVGSGNEVNGSGNDYTSWTFRKQKGFFDIVTYTGTGSVINLSHNLGCIPGCVMIKKTSATDNWSVYHRGLDSENPEYWWIGLNITNGRLATSGTTWNNTKPTSTHVTIGTGDQNVNTNGATYVAYIFAGGASTAATARSVYFGGDASLEIPSSSDLTLGTGDFTIETWVYPESFGNRSTIYDGRSSGGTTGITIGWEQTSGQVRVYMNASNGSDIVVQWDGLEKKQWTHIAVTRSSGTVRLFINGTEKDSATRTSDLNNTNAKIIGHRSYTSSSYDHMHGRISNFRLVKGTAVYTSSFKPSTQPLTDITNTKLLCCNNVSVTGATVTPGTITVGTGGHAGNPVAYAENPFDDPEGFKFGEEGDQNLIKTGSFIGAGSAAVDVNIGWEPSWVLIKNASATEDWFMFDSMRGVVSGGNDNRLQPNNTGAEFTTFDYIEFNSTGFKVNANATAGVNGTGDIMTFLAIRRPDGYVGKPVESGTDVFAMDTGVATSNIPNFDSGFPVDFVFTTEPATGGTHRYTGARLIQEKYIYTDLTNAEAPWDKFNFDSNVGWADWTGFSGSWQAWMWKRGAGFDVVTDKGNGATTKTIAHGLGVVPQMIWRKNRDGASDNWQVYHIGLNGGTNPQLYRLYLNTSSAEMSDQWTWDSAPTSTHFTVGSNGAVNRNNDDFITMLFASVEGISKCGYYTGNGSSITITTGFQPRFLVVKNVSGPQDWFVLDTTRGWGAGDDKHLSLNNNSAQGTWEFGAPTSTGFSFPSGNGGFNGNNEKYIYYAHA